LDLPCRSSTGAASGRAYAAWFFSTGGTAGSASSLWITYNRSTFFLSSYTPHTAHHNAYLERLLRERSVPYSSELRNGHLQGVVVFLPAGDISHRDFVTHAWADNPIKDILVRMDDADQGIVGCPHRDVRPVPSALAYCDVSGASVLISFNL
jgi:hypothetical protein